MSCNVFDDGGFSPTNARRGDRSFPWYCTKCQEMEVFPQVTDYTANVKHDGHPYTVCIPDLAIPTCRKCNERVFTPGVDDRIIAALRTQLDLLTPKDIQERRRELGLSQQVLAEQVGVAKETIGRWEAEAIILSRAMDNQLRRVFAFEEVGSSAESFFDFQKTALSPSLAPSLQKRTPYVPVSPSVSP